MKLKATLSDSGLRALEKAFLPTLEKLGKRCEVLLDPDGLHLIQGPAATEGLLIIARIASGRLFEEGHLVQSRCENRIAFSLEVGLLLRVLRSALAHDAERLEMKLVVRTVNTTGSTPEELTRLSFSWRGHNITIVQDLPVSKPYGREALEALARQASAESRSLCPFYLDIHPEMLRMQTLLDKLRGVAAEATLGTLRQGDLHLQVAAPGIHFGTELRRLAVVPTCESAMSGAQPLTGRNAEERLREGSGQSGAAGSVVLLAKHLSRALHSSHLTSPAQVLCGIGGQGDYVHFMFVFQDPYNEAEGYDKNVELSYKLPVRVEED